MSYIGTERDEGPLFWLRGRPVYVAYLVAAAYVASMIATTAILALGKSHAFNWMPYSSAQVLRGELWRLLTYGFFNRPSIMLAVDVIMIATFGREVERVAGRSRFIGLLACLYLLPVVVLTLLGNWMPSVQVGESGAFALFIAFATLYPEVPLLFGILAKWAALALVGIDSLMVLAYHDWVSGVVLWSTSAFAFGYGRYERGEFSLPRLWPRRRAPRLTVIEGGRQDEPAGPQPGSMAHIDALLDKIASKGIGSLTREERDLLDAARDRLSRRSRGR
jgi:membrane associated rhomboid family serine protease